MYILKKAIITVSVLLLSGCSSVTTNSNISETPKEQVEWLIPKEEIVHGGVPKDGIPSIDAPKFKPASEINYVDDHRLIIGVRVGDTIKGYPHQVMDHHEIVNDQIDQQPYALTYCPLTGTGIAWDRRIDGEVVEFGVSGLLFRNNLIPYDRKTGSNYSQMQMRAVNGARAGARLEVMQVLQTTWKTWKKVFPDAQVLTTETGHGNRNYGVYLYGEEYLEEDSEPLFPIRFDRLGNIPKKERIYGIIQKNVAISSALVQTYIIDDFGEGINLRNGQINNTKYIVAGSANLDFAVGFEKQLSDGTKLDFQPVQNSLPVIMKDQEGNRWDLFGYAVEGPREGERLIPALAYYGYWFAWGEFFLWSRT